MKMQYLDFGRYHGKGSIQGSTYIRMTQMSKYWDEFTTYKYGANPDVLIFQKVYATPDYKFPINFEGIKILDITDPDWLDEAPIVETAQAMDAVVCPTEPLAEFVRQFHTNVHVIPDRFDVEVIPEPKEHNEPAKTVVWFGYSHNSEALKPAMNLIDELKLNLIFISNDDPFPHKWSSRPYKEWYTFIKYSEDTVYQELQKADFAILPDGFRPQDRFKSNNKAIKANLAGLPVAKDSDQVRLYMEASERRKWFDENYDTIQSDYDVRNSVTDYKQLIRNIGKLG